MTPLYGGTKDMGPPCNKGENVPSRREGAPPCEGVTSRQPEGRRCVPEETGRAESGQATIHGEA